MAAVNLTHAPPPPPVGYVTQAEAQGELTATPAGALGVHSTDHFRVQMTRGLATGTNAPRSLHLGDVTVRHDEEWILERPMRVFHDAWDRLRRNIGPEPARVLWEASRPEAHATSPIKAIACHPFMEEFALVRYDDHVEVHPNSMEGPPRRGLADRRQRDIRCIGWSPASTSLLAVGCGSGVALWHVADVPTMTLLGGPPVNELCWSPDGTFLAAACPTKGSILVWDVARKTCTELRREKFVTLLSWSPDGQSLFAASSGKTFRIWDVSTWQSEPWNSPAPVVAACWSPDSKQLVFAVKGQANIQSLQFASDTAAAMTVLCDLSSAPSDEQTVGGEVQDLAWDDTGERLVVSFKASGVSQAEEDSDGRDLIAVFTTRTSRMHPTLLPSGFIRGPPGCHPQLMVFQPAVHVSGEPAKLGARLVTAWLNEADGVCSMYSIPFYFAQRRL